MNPDKRECFSNTGNHDHVSRLMRFILHLPNKRCIVGHALHLIQHKLLSFFLLLLGNPVGDPFVIADRQEYSVQVVLDQVAVQALIGHQLFCEMPNGHLVFRIVAEDPDVHFITQPFALQEFWLLYQSPEVIKTLHQIAHIPSLLTTGS